MAKPIYPFQPFMEVTISDSSECFSDRIFIPEDMIANGFIPSDFFYERLHALTAKLGYPLTKDDIRTAYDFLTVVSKEATTTIKTKSDVIGNVTISFCVIGVENENIPEEVELASEIVSHNSILNQDDLPKIVISDDDDTKGISVSGYINEVLRLNEYRIDKALPKSQIVIMIIPSDDAAMTESKCQWLHYHVNNYMNRGYKIYIEIETETGANLMQYIINCQYPHCVVVLNGEPEKYVKPLSYQPLGACSSSSAGPLTIESVMRQFSTHRLDPSCDTCKQTNALLEV